MALAISMERIASFLSQLSLPFKQQQCSCWIQIVIKMWNIPTTIPITQSLELFWGYESVTFFPV